MLRALHYTLSHQALFHLVSHSNRVTGAGVIGGSPYGCQLLPDSGDTCSGWMSTGHEENTSIPWPLYLKTCNAYLTERAAGQLVDPLASLQGRPVYLLSGLGDTTVYQQVMRAVAQQFTAIGTNVKTEFTLDLNHAWAVDNQTCSNTGAALPGNQCCGFKGTAKCPLPPHEAPVRPGGCCGGCGNLPGWAPPVNNCGYDMSGEMFKWLEAPRIIAARGVEIPSNLFTINQTGYIPHGWLPSTAFLDTVGFIYAPKKCRGGGGGGGGNGGGGGSSESGNAGGSASAGSNAMLSVGPALGPNSVTANGCSLHIHYHPCGGGYRDLSTNYMLGTGLAAYAETNDIVIFHPQTAGCDGSCWASRV